MSRKTKAPAADPNTQAPPADPATAAGDQGAPETQQAPPAAPPPDQPKAKASGKASGKARIICKLPNASDSINGVPFVQGEGGMVSAEMSLEAAERWLSIPGYELVK